MPPVLGVHRSDTVAISLGRHDVAQAPRRSTTSKVSRFTQPVNPCHPPRSDPIGRSRSFEPRIFMSEELVAAGVIDEYDRSAAIFARSTLHGR